MRHKTQKLQDNTYRLALCVGGSVASLFEPWLGSLHCVGKTLYSHSASLHPSV